MKSPIRRPMTDLLKIERSVPDSHEDQMSLTGAKWKIRINLVGFHLVLNGRHLSVRRAQRGVDDEREEGS